MSLGVRLIYVESYSHCQNWVNYSIDPKTVKLGTNKQRYSPMADPNSRVYLKW